MNVSLKTVFFIDGFNLYHSIDRNRHLHRYKWLDYRKLSEAFTVKNEIISKIYYFTALATWNPDKVRRHKQFISVLEDRSIDIIYGEFKLRDKYCPNCKKNFPKHEEKQTDVNIAIQMLKSATLHEFDKAFIMSGDSDLLAAIKTVKELYPEKKISAVIPYGRQAKQLQQTCDNYSSIKQHHLLNSRLPDVVTLSDGRIIHCPVEWK